MGEWRVSHGEAADACRASEVKVAELESELRDVREQGDRLAKILRNAADEADGLGL